MDPTSTTWISSCYTLDIMMFYIGYLARIHWIQSCYKLDIQLFSIGYPVVLYWISTTTQRQQKYRSQLPVFRLRMDYMNDRRLFSSSEWIT